MHKATEASTTPSGGNPEVMSVSHDLVMSLPQVSEQSVMALAAVFFLRKTTNASLCALAEKGKDALRHRMLACRCRSEMVEQKMPVIHLPLATKLLG